MSDFIVLVHSQLDADGLLLVLLLLLVLIVLVIEQIIDIRRANTVDT